MSFPVTFEWNDGNHYDSKIAFLQGIRSFIAEKKLSIYHDDAPVVALLANTRPDDEFRKQVLLDMGEYCYHAYSNIDGSNMTIKQEDIVVDTPDDTYKLFPMYAEFLGTQSLTQTEKVALQIALYSNTIELLSKGFKLEAIGLVRQFTKGLDLEICNAYEINLRTAKRAVEFIENHAVYFIGM